MYQELNECIPSREMIAKERMSREPEQDVAADGRLVRRGSVGEREDGEKRGTQGEDDTLSR